jgi:hypothetical protein
LIVYHIRQTLHRDFDFSDIPRPGVRQAALCHIGHKSRDFVAPFRSKFVKVLPTSEFF